MDRRSSGVLLHVTSLPGDFGIGDMGPQARLWIDQVAAAKQRWWQLLPLGPSAGGDAPYGCLSAFAGNPLFISPDDLLADGLLTQADLVHARGPDDRVNFERVVPAKMKMLDRAWTVFRDGATPALRSSFDNFCATHSFWLDDFALFMALRAKHGGESWISWPEDLVRRKPSALNHARHQLVDQIQHQQFLQFLFFRQWSALRDYCHARGIGIIGDVPIFVAYNSSDVWTNPHLFKLDRNRRPTVIAGVPPDYFSDTGQLWGNPLYRWPAMQSDDFAWWTQRIRMTLGLVDLLRIDHFRGLAACWEVPATASTAVDGRWVGAPGAELLSAFNTALGRLPFIAEDLGVITPDVVALRERFGLPGMRVLQFAFGDTSANPFLLHNYDRNTVVYTGTHDNDTAVGWFRSLPAVDRKRVMAYLPSAHPQSIGSDLVRLAWSSVARVAIAPVQDILNLPTRARMNMPGTVNINWRWRLKPGQWTGRDTTFLRDLTQTFGRHAE